MNHSISIQKIEDALQPAVQPIQRWTLHRDRVSSLAIVGDGVITCSEDAQLLLTSPTEGTVLLEQHEQPINHVALNQDKSLLLACSDDGSIYVYETGEFELQWRVEGFDDTGIRKAFFSRNQKIIAACNSGQVGIYDIETAQLALFDTHKVTIDAIAVHPSKPLALTNDMSGKTLIWDMQSNTVIHTLTKERGRFFKGLHHFGAHCALWTEEYIIIGHDELLIFNHDYRLLHKIKGFQFPPAELCLQDDILWAAGHALIAWNVKTLEKRGHLPQKPDIRSAQFDPDTAQLVTGHRDGQLKRWNGQALLAERHIIQHNGQLRFYAIGKEYIATAARDKTIIIWDREGQPIYQYYSNDERIAVIEFQYTYQLLFVEHSELKVLNVLLKSVRTIRSIGDKLHINHITIFDRMAIISAVSEFPRLLNLMTFNLTPLPYDLALYDCSNRLDGKIAFNGYTSDAKSAQKKDELTPLEAPVVMYDFQENAFQQALWLERPNRRGNWREKKLYPSVTLYEKERLITGYSNGTIAIWDTQKWELVRKIQPSKRSIRYLKKLPRQAGEPHDYYLIDDNDIYLVNSQLEPVLRCKLGSDLKVRFVDEALRLIVAYSIYGKKIYFMDMDTLEAHFTFPIKALVDAVIKSKGYYLVFTRSGLERFRINKGG